MKTLASLKKLVFNGLLSQGELAQLENSGLGLRVQMSPLARIEERDFRPAVIFEAEKMAAIYVAFYCLENSARELISTRLAERHGAEWWRGKIPKKIQSAAENLKGKELKNKYHSQRSGELIGYTMFGNLAQIIIANWNDFSDLFPDQAWISARFNDLELSRNVIMHTGSLPEIEQDRIASITRDWISQVG